MLFILFTICVNRSHFRSKLKKFSTLLKADLGPSDPNLVYCPWLDPVLFVWLDPKLMKCVRIRRELTAFLQVPYRSLRSGCKITGTLGQIRMCFLSISYFDGYFFISFYINPKLTKVSKRMNTFAFIGLNNYIKYQKDCSIKKKCEKNQI